jgi:cobalt-zinc-cadmium efflux system outer membrane protein
LRFALANRLDLSRAQVDVESAERALELERRQVFSDVAIGAAYEGGFGVNDSGGPFLDMEVPLFDQNQAQIARAEYELRQKRKQLTATRLHAREEVLDAVTEIEYRRGYLEIYRKRVAPAFEKGARHSERSRLQGDLDPIHALQMADDQIAAQRSYLESLWRLRRAHVALRRALWGSAS